MYKKGMRRVAEVLESQWSAEIERKERNLDIPVGFIGEVLESGGVVFLGFNLYDRSMHGWKARASGGIIGNKNKAVMGISGDSIVNYWGGLEVKSAKFVDPEEVEEGRPYVQVDFTDVTAIDLAGIKTADEVEEMFQDNPEQAELDVINSPWLTLSRLGLSRMAEVSPDGYLSVALPQLDEILFQ